MSPVHDRKAPGAGTKVDPGRKAPVTQEGAGFVDPESLAAESNREGGEFSGNRATDRSSGGLAYEHGNDQYDEPRSTLKAQPAPTGSGPHGKNLKEGSGFDDSRITDGLKKALDSEPGSMDDPSRLAEAKFAQNAATAPSGAGRRDEKLSTGTAFDGLDRETSS